MTTILFALLAVAAGVAAAVQSAANAGLAQRIGLGMTLIINTCVVMVGSVALWLASDRRFDLHPAGTPWVYYIGGACGFLIIFGLAVVFPRIGAAVAIALVVLGQSTTALAIDHYGLLGMPKDPVTLARVLGVVLVAGGAALLRT